MVSQVTLSFLFYIGHGGVSLLSVFKLRWRGEWDSSLWGGKNKSNKLIRWNILESPLLSSSEQGREGAVVGGWIRRRWDEMHGFGLFSQTTHLCYLLEAGREKTHTRGSGFGNLLQHFDWKLTHLPFLSSVQKNWDSLSLFSRLWWCWEHLEVPWIKVWC